MIQLTGGVKDWADVRGVAKQGFNDGIVCLATIEVVERSNTPAVIDPLHELKASRAAKLLIDAALVRLHLYLVRAFARVSHDDDLHLRAAIGFLRTADLQAELPFVEDQDHIQRAIELFDISAADPRLAKLKKLRDKQIAHLALYDDSDAPTYNDLFGFARTVATIWERLAWGTGIVSLSIDSQVVSYQESADAFWSPWER
jgi:hypothetical protein